MKYFCVNSLCKLTCFSFFGFADLPFFPSSMLAVSTLFNSDPLPLHSPSWPIFPGNLTKSSAGRDAAPKSLDWVSLVLPVNKTQR